jgi:hypothetical protein
MSVTGHLQPANIDWTTIRNTANAELARRSSNGTAAPAIANPISASEWNSIVAAFNVSDPHTDSAYNTSGTLTVTTWGPTGAPGAPSGYPVTGGQVQRITSAYAIALCNALNAAGAVCTCNCNYCTCNCNYCTCNCNYACTCNCNYSDIRLKENVEFVETQCGLNIYSWNYKWDKNSTYHGVLAHELVGTQYSCALTLDPAGYYMVDYNQLPVEMSKE